MDCNSGTMLTLFDFVAKAEFLQISLLDLIHLLNMIMLSGMGLSLSRWAATMAYVQEQI